MGPAVVAAPRREIKDVKVDLHAHRSVLLIESVRLGRYHIGLLPKVERHVTLFTRKTVNQWHSFAHLRVAIADAAARHFSARSLTLHDRR